MAHIMVVDDERDVVVLIKFLLERDGHEISVAYNGSEALAQLRLRLPQGGTDIPDLIILDVMMPVMDGFTFCARAAEDEALAKIPLIILTAKGEMRDLFQLSPNVANYLEKPFDPNRLREVVSSLLAKPK